MSVDFYDMSPNEQVDHLSSLWDNGTEKEVIKDMLSKLGFGAAKLNWKLQPVGGFTANTDAAVAYSDALRSRLRKKLRVPYGKSMVSLLTDGVGKVKYPGFAESNPEGYLDAAVAMMSLSQLVGGAIKRGYVIPEAPDNVPDEIKRMPTKDKILAKVDKFKDVKLNISDFENYQPEATLEPDSSVFLEDYDLDVNVNL